MKKDTWFKVGFNNFLRYKHTTATGKLSGFLVVISGNLDNPIGLSTRNVSQKFRGTISEATESESKILEKYFKESL